MLRLDILGFLTTLLLLDIFSAKRVIVISMLLNLASMIFILFLDIPFMAFNLAGIFSFFEVGETIYEWANLAPFILGLILSRSVDKERLVDTSYLIPWNQSNAWSVLIYKFGFYNLLFQVIRFFMRS